MSIETAFVSSVDVGAGNPSHARARARQLEKHGVNVAYESIAFSAIAVQWLHSYMRENPHVYERYTKESENVRGGLAMTAFGVMALLEFFSKHKDWILKLLRDELVYSLGLGVQEHQYAGMSPQILRQLFGLCILDTADVYPKKSADHIFNKGVIPSVWNQAALQQLRLQGYDTLFVEPALPRGFSELPKMGQTTDDIVLISSGSGLPDQLRDTMIGGLRLTGRKFDAWLPGEGRWVSNNSDLKLSQDTAAIQAEIYRRLHDTPPAILISPPSEKVQVAAALRTEGWTGILAPYQICGDHERLNTIWGVRNGLLYRGLLDTSSADAVARHIDSILKRSYPHLTEKEMGLGTQSIYDAAHERSAL